MESEKQSDFREQWNLNLWAAKKLFREPGAKRQFSLTEYHIWQNLSMFAFTGSCTACVLSLYKKEKTLYTANLGDSGFLVIRSGKVVARSEEQQHYFNTPFQLAMAPTTLEGVVLSDRYVELFLSQWFSLYMYFSDVRIWTRIWIRIHGFMVWIWIQNCKSWIWI